MNELNKNQIDRDASPQNDSLIQKLWDAKVVIAIALMAVLVRACYNQEAGVPPALVNTSEVSNNTEEFIGKTVTIISKPIKKLGLSSFTVSDRRFFGGDPIVVVNASGVPFDLPTDRDTEVQVMGEVSNLVIPEVERRFKLKLQDEYYKNYINKPAIIARSMVLAANPGQVTKNPRKYYNRRLALTGKVENIQSPVLLTLGENQLFGGENLLILLNATPKAAIKQGRTLSVIGVVRPFVVGEIERDYNLKWDQNVKNQMQAKYGNKPVFVAEVVYP